MPRRSAASYLAPKYFSSQDGKYQGVPAVEFPYFADLRSYKPT